MVTGDAREGRDHADGLGAGDGHRPDQGGRLPLTRARAALAFAHTYVAPLACVTALLGLGCAASPGAVVAADAKAARADQTPEKLAERGRAFAQMRDYTRAEQYLSAALDAGAPPAEVLPVLLKACIAENRFRAALTYAEPQLRAHPEDFRLRFVVASLYASIGDTVTAVDHLERVAASQPDLAEVHYALAVLLRDGANDPARADVHFREYLRLEPDGPHAPEARGALLTVVRPTKPDAAPAEAPELKEVPTELSAPAAPAPAPVPAGGPRQAETRENRAPAAPAKQQGAAAEPGPRPVPVRP